MIEKNCFESAKVTITTYDAKLPLPIQQITNPPKTLSHITDEQRIWTDKGIVRADDQAGPTDQEREQADGVKNHWGDSLNQIPQGVFRAFRGNGGDNKKQDGRDWMPSRFMFGATVVDCCSGRTSHLGANTSQVSFHFSLKTS